MTGGIFAQAPANAGEIKQCYKQLSRASRNYALVADMTVAMLGGGLKTKQKISGRLADALSELYILSCVLKRFEDDGRHEDDDEVVALAMANGLNRYERAMVGAIDNFPVVPMRFVPQVESSFRLADITIRHPTRSATNCRAVCLRPVVSAIA